MLRIMRYDLGDNMSGIGPQNFSGWNSGAATYDRARQRRDTFLAGHPTWTIELNRETDAYDAIQKSDDITRQISAKSLGSLMDQLEAVYAPEGE
jgi:hypothetical protein